MSNSLKLIRLFFSLNFISQNENFNFITDRRIKCQSVNKVMWLQDSLSLPTISPHQLLILTPN